MATQVQRQAARKQVEDLRAERARTERTRTERNEAIKRKLKADQQRVEDAEVVDIPSGRRVLIGTVLGIAAGVGVGYGVSAVMAYAVAAATIYTASTFLATLIWVIGFILAVYAGLKTASSVFGYVISKQDIEHVALIKTSASNLRDRVRGMWNSDAEVVEA